jgi:protein-ribulosamine 3-kinase
MISQSIVERVEQQFSDKIVAVTAVSGGGINRAFCLSAVNGKYFIKLNSAQKYPGMFEAEAAGLRLIAGTGAIATPNVMLRDSVDDESFLLLEWINSRRPTIKASEQFGVNLARMHRCTSDAFGLAHDNYMGSLSQSNNRYANWLDFFIAERLEPMAKMAARKGLLKANDLAAFERLNEKLPTLFNEESPSLIHGDLWSGNYLVSENEIAYLIDPAVTYGHREFDIAMTTLFGGFSEVFYEAYNKEFPLAKGWQQRLGLWNLYPLLVHLNLFGVSYLLQVRNCLKQYL